MKHTLEQRITHAAARVAVAWSNMDEQQALEWQAEVDRLCAIRDRRDNTRKAMCSPVSFYARPAS